MKNAFLNAAKENRAQELEGFLRQDRTLLEETDEKGCTALYLAAKAGSKEAVKFLLKQGANPNHLSINHWSPLHAACKMLHIEIVKLLLGNKKTHINGNQNPSQSTPLHVLVTAIAESTVAETKEIGREIVDLLLSDEIILDLPDVNQQTPLDLAKKHKDLALIYVLEQAIIQQEEGLDPYDNLTPTSSDVHSRIMDEQRLLEMETYSRAINAPCPPNFPGYAWREKISTREKTPVAVEGASGKRMRNNK